jgi:hypothetical protein
VLRDLRGASHPGLFRSKPNDKYPAQRLKQEAFEIETSLNLNNKTKRDTQEYLIGAV